MEWVCYIRKKHKCRDVTYKGEWEQGEQQPLHPGGKNVRWILGREVSPVRDAIPYFGGVG
jgi:hypothetical protein